MILEVHYHNAARFTGEDRSGMAICTTSVPRRYAAGVLTSGTEQILVPARSQAEARGSCPPTITRG
jgi:hypothetical protein